jgi:hypothetical protein
VFKGYILLEISARPRPIKVERIVDFQFYETLIQKYDILLWMKNIVVGRLSKRLGFRPTKGERT